MIPQRDGPLGMSGAGFELRVLMGEAIVVLFVSDEQIYLQQIGSSNEICGLYLIIPEGENRMETLYRSY